MSNDRLSEEENLDRYQKINYAVQCLRLEQTWKELKTAGIDPILIKGWAAAQYYPEPASRPFTDVDLAVNPKDKSKIESLVLRSNKELIIDWHYGLRHLDSRSFEELYKNSQLIACGSEQIRVLCPEDHLRVLAVHWLTDGGEYQNKLWDIYYLIEQTRQSFDWDKCLSVVTKKRRRWILIVLAITAKYLNLNLNELENSKYASDNEIPTWVTRTIEKEWATDVRLMPLDFVQSNRKLYRQQLRKRFPPNPIQATVLEDGDFDRYPRWIYQIKHINSRLNLALRKKYNRK